MTASLPASARATTSGRVALQSAALVGSIDLLRADPTAELICRRLDHEMVLTAPGLELHFDVRRVAWHAAASSLTLSFGRPSLDGAVADPEQVHRALGAASQPWRRFGGRYALVHVDRGAGEVLFATDRFAVWPITWCRAGSTIGFSDRADRVPSTEPGELDPQALFDYVYFHVIPAPRTVFRGVRRVEPATALRFSQIGVEQQPTWEPSFASAGPKPSHEEFRSTVRSAVLAEADDSASGCFLSGGTDSSTVAGMLARERGAVKTFSIGFEADGYDEMAYARIAARHFGTDHHEYYVTPEDLVRSVPLVATHYDQPFGNSSAVPAYTCALMAGHSGVRKVLAGDGGDELFGGNVRYARQKVFETYQGIPSALRAALVEPLLLNKAARSTPGLSKVASYVEQARVEMPGRMETYNLLRRFGAQSVFTPHFLERVDAAAPEALQSAVYRRAEEATFVDRMLAYDWRFTLSDNDLPKVTGTTRLAGLDVGFPLLADTVVDLSLRLDARDKVRGLKLRHFFKAALTDFLPPEIIVKKKHGFGLPVGPWLVSHAGFRGMAYEAVNGLADRGVIQSSLVADLFSRRLEEHPGYYGEMVWVLMMLEHWLRSRAPSWTCR